MCVLPQRPKPMFFDSSPRFALVPSAPLDSIFFFKLILAFEESSAMSCLFADIFVNTIFFLLRPQL